MKIILCSLALTLLLCSEAPGASLDLATTATGALRFGRQMLETQVSQSFKIGNVSITGATIAVARRGTPTVPITVSLKKTLSGNALATTTIQPSNGISTDPSRPTMVAVTFPTVVTVAAGEYFLVLSAPNTPTSGTNHYYVGVGRPDVGVFLFKGSPHSLDLVGSIRISSGEPPPPPAPPPPPPPPPQPTSFEGYGITEGGNNGETYVVNSLADSGPGSLRDAISQANRRIVFDVAGEIMLEDRLEMRFPFITIDGFTAPSPGITVVGGGIACHAVEQYIPDPDCHDVIIRGLRFRQVHGDAIQISWGAHHVVVDHVSAVGSGDGNIDITHGAHDVTVSWSLMGMSTNNQLIKPMSGSDITPPTNRVTLHHNAYIGGGARNPRISNGLGNLAQVAVDLTVDMRNNVIANWRSGIGTDVECGARVNIVNNFYSSANSQLTDKKQAIIIRGENSAGADFAGCLDSQGNGVGGDAHVKGNVSGDNVGVDINTNPQWIKDNQPDPFPVPQEARVTMTEACTAAKQVLQGVGVFPRDQVDEGLIASVALGSCGN